MSTRHHLLASDADRDRLVAMLQHHTAAGRLSLDEYSERVDQVVRARTYGELAAVVQDLPAEPAADDALGSGRQLVIAFLLALLALAVIGAAIAVFR